MEQSVVGYSQSAVSTVLWYHFPSVPGQDAQMGGSGGYLMIPAALVPKTSLLYFGRSGTVNNTAVQYIEGISVEAAKFVFDLLLDPAALPPIDYETWSQCRHAAAYLYLEEVHSRLLVHEPFPCRRRLYQGWATELTPAHCLEKGCSAASSSASPPSCCVTLWMDPDTHSVRVDKGDRHWLGTYNVAGRGRYELILPGVKRVEVVVRTSTRCTLDGTELCWIQHGEHWF
ncbi:hypothetical protein Pelo_4170 [Pelomyxa schiedti]|nr:hypothetical protein Pelo_4170 [Pelomyxa schiedti]